MRALPLILALGVALLLAAGSAPGEPAAAGAGGPPSTTAMVGLVSWQEDQLLTERHSRYRYIVVRDVRRRTRRGLAELIAANPRTEVLLYANAGFMVHDRSDPNSCGYWPYNGDGVDFCEARRKRESWFLHRSPAFPGEPAPARRLTSEAYPASWAADIGARGYRREWIRNVRARLGDAEGDSSRVRAAGVFIDDLNLLPGHGLDGEIAEYSDEAYREAAVGFGSRIGRVLGRAGYVTMANVGIDPHAPEQREAMLRLAAGLTAVNREQFVRFGDDGSLFTTPRTNGNDWLTELELFETLQAAGAGYLALVYGGAPTGGLEREAAEYARATFLLGWDGRSPSAVAFRTTDGSDPGAHDVWQTAIGAPIEARVQVGERVAFARRYSGGVALVNADPAESQLFRLDGLYRHSSGVCLSLVVLGPATGRVMPTC